MPGYMINDMSGRVDSISTVACYCASDLILPVSLPESSPRKGLVRELTFIWVEATGIRSYTIIHSRETLYVRLGKFSAYRPVTQISATMTP